MNMLNHLSSDQREAVFNQVGVITGLPAAAIEKDWWVTAVLRALFELPYAVQLSFKGGTSLSKCFGVISRFSEDIDIAINREYLGFVGDTFTKKEITKKLRKAACSFVREQLQNDLRLQLINDGINATDFFVNVNITEITTTDPEVIEVEYRTIFQGYEYINRKVKVEVSGRSMSEPIERVNIQSIIDETLPNVAFVEGAIEVNAVSPKRTFLEKICLLHEEFVPTNQVIRTERMSRHLYDLSQMMDTPIAQEALEDKALFDSVVAHRRLFIGLKDFDYNTLSPASIQIVPPSEVIALWQADYYDMCETMIYGHAPTFEQLIEKIRNLNEEIKQLI